MRSSTTLASTFDVLAGLEANELDADPSQADDDVAALVGDATTDKE